MWRECRRISCEILHQRNQNRHHNLWKRLKSDSTRCEHPWILRNGRRCNITPFTLTYDKEGNGLMCRKIPGFYSIPEGSTVKVSPVHSYIIDSLSLRGGSFETTRLGDGSYTFICDYDTFFYQSVYVNMSLSPEAIRFSITVDYAPNITAALENQREGSGNGSPCMTARTTSFAWPQTLRLRFSPLTALLFFPWNGTGTGESDRLGRRQRLDI